MADSGGVRLVHSDPSYAGSVVVVPTFRRYGTPRLCTICKVAHDVKHYHLHLDGQASVIVSPTVLARLRDIGMAGFTVASQIAKPPPLRVGGRPDRRELRLLSKALEGVVPPGMRVTVTNGSS